VEGEKEEKPKKKHNPKLLKTEKKKQEKTENRNIFLVVYIIF